MLLPWQVFTFIVVPMGLWNSAAVGCLSLLYGVLLSGILTALSWERSAAWRAFCVVCWMAALLGFGLSVAVIQNYPLPGDGTLNQTALVIVLAAELGLFVLVVALGVVLPLCGCGIIGSSADFAKREGWGWEPKAVRSMELGWDCSFGALTRSADDFPERVTHDLLMHRAYWSGEPAVDYIFWVAQEHLYLSCVLCHPAAPFSKAERILVAAIVSCLVVFPVACLEVCVESPLVRTAAAAVLVTAPRNLLKAALRKVVVAPGLHEDKRLASHGSKLRRLVRKHVTRKGQMAFDLTATKAHRQHKAKRSVVFFAIVVCFTVSVCVICSDIIEQRSDTPLKTALNDASVGLLFGFVIELIMHLVFHARAADGSRPRALYVGVFNRWWMERKEYGKLKPPRGPADSFKTPYEMWVDVLSIVLAGASHGDGGS